MRLSDRVNTMGESGTSKMRNLANKLKSDGVPVINFAAGELDFDTSLSIKKYAQLAINNKENNKYTEGLGIASLRNYIVQNASSRLGVNYELTEIAITSGAKYALFSVILALFQDGDEVIVPTPCWGTYCAQISLSRATPVLFETTNDGYQINAEKLKLLINNNTRGIIINTPNNPTGDIYTKESLAAIANIALEHKLWIIFDECYKDLVYDSLHHYNIVNLYPQLKPQAILVNSFSKTYAITGWRIGYVLGNKNVISSLKNLNGHTISNVTSIVQHALLAVFEQNHTAYCQKIVNVLSTRRNKAISKLNKMPYISYTKPDGAFYVYLNLEKVFGKHYGGAIINNVEEFALLALDKAHLATVPGNAFYDSRGIRISFAIEEPEIEKGLVQLHNFLLELR